MMTTGEIRRTFLDYFRKNDHEIVPSSSLVPHNDPTLMFTNSGMVQFKNIFTGMEKRPYVRAASDQKCVRAGGKHNDLDNVGYTVRHHTFFEMLGNWSFGDYFKEKAIYYAWNLVTREFGLPREKLTATVYHTDDEAYNLWKKIAGLPDERIIRIPTKDNFWSMGDTGPCGPCSEIFYDHGEHIQGGPPGSPDEDGDRFVEIWNLVFMQNEQLADGRLIDLPHRCIDTGMGLERMGAVMLGTNDNYETEILKGLILAAAGTAGVEPYGEFKTSLRIIADHLRSSCFLIADGVLPSNEGRGYVLRRIMRRAMRHAHMMGCQEPLMWRLVPALVRLMGDVFPELTRAQALITETLRLEETRFKETLGRGLKLLDMESAKLADGGVLSGDVAFRLYDTYGFPLDLTQDVLRGKHMGVDTQGFEAAMERQKAEARKAWAGSGEAATDAVWFETKEKVGGTEFLGYETLQAEGQIAALVVDGKEVDSVKEGQKAAVITNQTPFYGESGGQVGDTGTIAVADSVLFDVTDTQKKVGDLFIHFGVLKKGDLKKGLDVLMTVDAERRAATARHHSVTHLLQAALRKILGDHVTQKGSSVRPDGMRFDFSQPRPITFDELRAVENEVNRNILKNLEVATRITTPDAAVKEGAMALFGEKYGDEVRVVSMGSGADKVSVELCGGTHVKRTGDIGSFRILSEAALAAGVRRIEAVTGMPALAYAQSRDDLLAKTAESLKAPVADIPARVQALIDERKKLERELSDLRKKLAAGGTSGDNGAKKINGVSFVGRVLSGIPAKELKGMADEIKKQIGSGVVALVCTDNGKVSIVVGVTNDLTAKINAVDLVRLGAAAADGKGGGGRPDMAQAGGSDVSKTAEVLSVIEKALGA
ncbi:MAG TPA: alanine--tRNA ligase [Alphaproteobacteria bacterium]|nr:alanine--tRNA ligase [Alphaproteobacteria bacterium]